MDWLWVFPPPHTIHLINREIPPNRRFVPKNNTTTYIKYKLRKKMHSPPYDFSQFDIWRLVGWFGEMSTMLIT